MYYWYKVALISLSSYRITELMCSKRNVEIWHELLFPQVLKEESKAMTKLHCPFAFNFRCGNFFHFK